MRPPRRRRVRALGSLAAHSGTEHTQSEGRRRRPALAGACMLCGAAVQMFVEMSGGRLQLRMDGGRGGVGWEVCRCGLCAADVWAGGRGEKRWGAWVFVGVAGVCWVRRWGVLGLGA